MLGTRGGGRNRAPTAVATLPDLMLAVDGTAFVDVLGGFRDPDGDALTYRATSSAPEVVSAAVSGSSVTVRALSVGAALVTVSATDTGGSNTAAFQSFAVTVAALPAPFSDDPLLPGVTPIKAVHFTELRMRIDVLRQAGGLGRFPWTDKILRAGVTPVKLVHLHELREALVATHAVLGRQVPSWTDPAPVRGATPIRVTHLMELRAAVVALERGAGAGAQDGARRLAGR